MLATWETALCARTGVLIESCCFSSLCSAICVRVYFQCSIKLRSCKLRKSLIALWDFNTYSVGAEPLLDCPSQAMWVPDECENLDVWGQTKHSWYSGECNQCLDCSAGQKPPFRVAQAATVVHHSAAPTRRSEQLGRVVALEPLFQGHTGTSMLLLHSSSNLTQVGVEIWQWHILLLHYLNRKQTGKQHYVDVVTTVIRRVLLFCTKLKLQQLFFW